jgi:uncharacterized membrane protein
MVMILTSYLFMLIGFYFVTIALWELREGVNRKQFITYMLIGLVFIFMIPTLFGFTVNMFQSIF